MTDTRAIPGRSSLDGGVPALGAAPPVFNSEQIADLLDVLAAANSALAVELEAISVSRASLSQVTVNRLEQLVEQMRPAAQVREVLAGLDPGVLLGRCAGVAPAAADRHRPAAMSKHLAQIGVPGQVVDVLAGGDVDTAGRLLSVAELQAALSLALQRSRPDVDHRTDGPGGAADSGTSRPGSHPTQDSPIATGPTGGIACPDHEHPTVPGPEAGRPDPAAHPAAPRCGGGGGGR